MKRYLLFGISVAAGLNAVAQDVIKDDNDKVKEAVTTIATSGKSELGEASPDSAVWVFPGSFGINAAQSSHNCYSTDGTGTAFAIDGYIKLNANYSKKNIRWNNGLSLGYGVNFSTSYTHAPKQHKSIDEIILNSKFGLKANKIMFYTVLASYETQFTPTYDYNVIDAWYESNGVPKTMDDGSVRMGRTVDQLNGSFNRMSNDSRIKNGFVKSKFANPAYLKASVGVDFMPIPKESFSVFISPVTARFTFCKNDIIAPNYSMKLNEDGTYEDTRSEIGALLRVDYSKKFNKIIDLNASIEGFISYNETVQQVDKDFREDVNNYIYDLGAIKDMEFEYENRHGGYVKFKTDIVFKVTKFFNIAFKTQFKYDNAEVSYHKDVQKLDYAISTYNTAHGSNYNRKTYRENIDPSAIDIGDKKYDYGYKKAHFQFWESTSLGLTYIF